MGWFAGNFRMNKEVSLGFHCHMIGELRLDSLLVSDASSGFLTDSAALFPVFLEGY
jgi:hypothetical protein